MKQAQRILSLLAALCLTVSGMASAETKLFDPVAIVSYDRCALPDWTPSYSLSMPGILLELTHAEAMLSVAAIAKEEASPAGHLSERLDRVGELLSVSDAQLNQWADPFEGDGRLLSYSYTYPDGDETHLFRCWTASREDMLIELAVDAWGEDAELLLETAQAAFIESAFALTVSKSALELTATLSDAVESENGLVYVQLTEAGQEFSRSDTYYPLSQNAVILFPNPDDPLLLTPVEPDFASLVDAILLYEESSDSPAVFYTLIENNQIIYMEYGLMQ